MGDSGLVERPGVVLPTFAKYISRIACVDEQLTIRDTEAFLAVSLPSRDIVIVILTLIWIASKSKGCGVMACYKTLQHI